MLFISFRPRTFLWKQNRIEWRKTKSRKVYFSFDTWLVAIAALLIAVVHIFLHFSHNQLISAQNIVDCNIFLLFEVVLIRSWKCNDLLSVSVQRRPRSNKNVVYPQFHSIYLHVKIDFFFLFCMFQTQNGSRREKFYLLLSVSLCILTNVRLSQICGIISKEFSLRQQQKKKKKKDETKLCNFLFFYLFWRFDIQMSTDFYRKRVFFFFISLTVIWPKSNDFSTIFFCEWLLLMWKTSGQSEELVKWKTELSSVNKNGSMSEYRERCGGWTELLWM